MRNVFETSYSNSLILITQLRQRQPSVRKNSRDTGLFMYVMEIFHRYWIYTCILCQLVIKPCKDPYAIIADIVRMVYVAVIAGAELQLFLMAEFAHHDNFGCGLRKV